MGVVSPVSEIWLPFKNGPWSSKNIIYRNWLKKIHASRGQCHVHVHQFWWAWSLRFRRYGYLSKTAKFPFWGMDYSPWSSKNLINRNRLKKFMQVGVNVTCMYISFGGRGLSGFGDMATFQKRPNFPFGPWTIVHGHRKI